jgi:hypothetical protein
MTQNTTKNDKREQCDTKHNAPKIYLMRKKFTPYVSYPVSPAHAPASVLCSPLAERLSSKEWNLGNVLTTGTPHPLEAQLQKALLGSTWNLL